MGLRMPVSGLCCSIFRKRNTSPGMRGHGARPPLLSSPLPLVCWNSLPLCDADRILFRCYFLESISLCTWMESYGSLHCKGSRKAHLVQTPFLHVRKCGPNEGRTQGGTASWWQSWGESQDSCFQFSPILLQSAGRLVPSVHLRKKKEN